MDNVTQLIDSIARLSESLKWPLTALVVLLSLRNRISDLVPRLRSLEWGDKRANFQEQLQDLNKAVVQATSDRAVSETETDPDEGGPRPPPAGGVTVPADDERSPNRRMLRDGSTFDPPPPGSTDTVGDPVQVVRPRPMPAATDRPATISDVVGLQTQVIETLSAIYREGTGIDYRTSSNVSDVMEHLLNTKLIDADLYDLVWRFVMVVNTVVNLRTVTRPDLDEVMNAGRVVLADVQRRLVDIVQQRLTVASATPRRESSNQELLA